MEPSFSHTVGNGIRVVRRIGRTLIVGINGINFFLYILFSSSSHTSKRRLKILWFSIPCLWISPNWFPGGLNIWYHIALYYWTSQLLSLIWYVRSRHSTDPVVKFKNWSVLVKGWPIFWGTSRDCRIITPMMSTTALLYSSGPSYGRDPKLFFLNIQDISLVFICLHLYPTSILLLDELAIVKYISIISWKTLLVGEWYCMTIAAMSVCFTGNISLRVEESGQILVVSPICIKIYRRLNSEGALSWSSIEYIWRFQFCKLPYCLTFVAPWDCELAWRKFPSSFIKVCHV